MHNALLANLDIRDLLLVNRHGLYLLDGFAFLGNISMRTGSLVDVVVGLEIGFMEIRLFLCLFLFYFFNAFDGCLSSDDRSCINISHLLSNYLRLLYGLIDYLLGRLSSSNTLITVSLRGGSTG